MSNRHKWKEFSKIVNAPYRKRFSTNGWGDFRIDNRGLYSYESKAYDDDKGHGFSCYVWLFLDGEIMPYDWDKDEEGYCVD